MKQVNFSNRAISTVGEHLYSEGEVQSAEKYYTTLDKCYIIHTFADSGWCFLKRIHRTRCSLFTWRSK
jgi:hypothetical protein